MDVHGPALRHVRTTTSDYSVRGLAAEVGLPFSQLSRLERGLLGRVRPDVFDALLLALRIEDRRVLMTNPRSALPTAA